MTPCARDLRRLQHDPSVIRCLEPVVAACAYDLRRLQHESVLKTCALDFHRFHHDACVTSRLKRMLATSAHARVFGSKIRTNACAAHPSVLKQYIM